MLDILGSEFVGSEVDLNRAIEIAWRGVRIAVRESYPCRKIYRLGLVRVVYEERVYFEVASLGDA